MKTKIPLDYRPILDLKQTELAIKLIKDFFQQALSTELKLRRVTAPLFVAKGTGINDDLNGVERPASFPVKNLNDREVEMVQSLAKWKRMALADYDLEEGYGLYTDMNAIRPDDTIDATHSIYVDQWDWELFIRPEDRTLAFLKKIVKKIYSVIKNTEFLVREHYPDYDIILPDDITFVHTQEALDRFPELSPKEREQKLAEEYGAVFLVGIGGELSNGTIHDGRAPDYDDWNTPGEKGMKGLNGDILLWHPVLKNAFEISSMGIRVDRDTLLKQLAIRDCEERKQLYWHKRLLAGEFPQSIGGGIGQSRLCMYYLRKAHIGEVQSGIWPEETLSLCRERSIPLM